MAFTALDHSYMARALQLARRGWYTTHPNPRVGCVLVKADGIVGEGWHQQAGQAHAEVNAINDAADNARDSHAYITLEPCTVTGRTPPCTDALLQAGINKVTVAMEDPNQDVLGQGLQLLSEKGIETRVGLMQAQAEALNRGYCKRQRDSMPWLRIKMAQSLDGRTAMQDGDSKWISCEASRRDVQFLRAQSACVLSGIDTVLMDDPSLNVRLALEDLPGATFVPHPVRVILDSDLRMPVDAKLLSMPGQVSVFTACADKAKIAALKAKNVDIINIAKTENGLDLRVVLEELAARGINEVQVEAGARVCGAFIAAGLVDELVCYLSPFMLGDSARALAHLPSISSMQQRLSLDLVDMRKLGSDLRLTYEFLNRD